MATVTNESGQIKRLTMRRSSDSVTLYILLCFIYSTSRLMTYATELNPSYLPHHPSTFLNITDDKKDHLGHHMGHYNTSMDLLYGADLRFLGGKEGYASGASSIFWLNGRTYDDFPYLCKCDRGELDTYKEQGSDGLLPDDSDVDRGIAGGLINSWNSATQAVAPTTLGPKCAGVYTAAVFSSGPPKCDVENSHSSRVMHLSPFLILLLTVASLMFSIL